MAVAGIFRDPRAQLGEQKPDSYLLGNGVADDDVAFWDVPGHSGRVGSEVSDCHIHRRRRPVCECQQVSRLTGSIHRLALVNSHLHLLLLTCPHKAQVTADQQEDRGT